MKDDNGENLYTLTYGKVLYENDNGNTGTNNFFAIQKIIGYK